MQIKRRKNVVENKMNRTWNNQRGKNCVKKIEAWVWAWLHEKYMKCMNILWWCTSALIDLFLSNVRPRNKPEKKRKKRRRRQRRWVKMHRQAMRSTLYLISIYVCMCSRQFTRTVRCKCQYRFYDVHTAHST